MNYLHHYNLLISKRKLNPLPYNIYGEKHHIIPKCIGGLDEIENIVRLSAKEHFMAHAMLFKHYKSPQLAFAWNSMRRISNNQKRNLTSLDYRLLKTAFSSSMSYRQKNKTDAEIENWVKKVASKPKSKQHRKKIGRKGLSMLQNVETGKIIRAARENYDENIWVNPRKITPEKRVKCKKCGVISIACNIKRWHNENCTQDGVYVDPSKIRKTSRRRKSIVIDNVKYESLRQAELNTKLTKYQIRKLYENQIDKLCCSKS